MMLGDWNPGGFIHAIHSRTISQGSEVAIYGLAT
jgi:hypothetical protein